MRDYDRLAQQRYVDTVRAAAAAVALAARRLTELQQDPLWRPKALTEPCLADLEDAQARITAILDAAGVRRTMAASPASGAGGTT